MIRDNLTTIRQQIFDAAERSGRDPLKVQLLAVSKRFDVQKIQEAFDQGQLLFGENYIQEAEKKIYELPSSISWHFIGHLQSNKAKLAAQLFQVIETVDRLKIAKALNKHAQEIGKTLDILVQINIGQEKQKAGVDPQDAELLLKELGNMENLRIRGLMAMPPFSNDPEQTRPHFKALRKMSDQFTDKGYFAHNAPTILSMGMSNDFRVAIEEGSTLVRIGTSIFGKRT